MSNRTVPDAKIMNPSQFCTVQAVGEPNRGGAHTLYHVYSGVNGPNPEEPDALASVEVCEIRFQDGHPGEVGYNGILDSALLAVLIDRLKGFQSGPFSSREGAIALTKLEEALLWMDKRVANRTAQGVMNTDKNHS